jgi:hypothetical protein
MTEEKYLDTSCSQRLFFGWKELAGRAAILVTMIIGCTPLDHYQIPEKNPQRTCTACTEAECASELDACSKSLDCQDFHNCLLACQEDHNMSACDAKCLGDFFDFGLATNVTICQSMNCANECERPCGGWAYRVDGCANCIQNKCCEEARSCSRNPDCVDVYACYSRCTPGDWGCYYDCNTIIDVSKYTEQVAPFETCYMTKCRVECGTGSSWSCVGLNGPISTKERETTISVRLISLSGHPVGGATALLCNWDDPICEVPRASAQSDEQGIANLTYDVNFRDKKVRIDISKPGHMGASMFFSRPLSAAPSSLIGHDMGVPYASWLLLTPDEIDQLAIEFGVNQEDNCGHALFTMFDCSAYAASNLVVSAPGTEGATPFYVIDGYPTSSASCSNTTGVAGFLNLPAGAIEMEAHLVGQEKSPVLRESLKIKAGEITYGIFWPK